MAKNDRNDVIDDSPLDDVIDDSPPEGFEAAADDIQAYWLAATQGIKGRDGRNPAWWYDPEYGYKPGSPPILFTPLDCVLMDSSIDSSKTSTLIFGRLERAQVLQSANPEEGEQRFEKGTIVGIWGKPGMRSLLKLGNTVVWMANGKEIAGKKVNFKDLGADYPNPMVVFDIRHEAPGQPLAVREDRREESMPRDKPKKGGKPKAPPVAQTDEETENGEELF